MKINFKSKRILAGLLSLVLLGFGVADPRLGTVAVEITCETVVKCDA